MEQASKTRAFALLILTFFIWGSLYVGGKVIADDIPAPLVACVRCIVSVFPLWMMAKKHRDVRIEPEDIKYFAAVGILGYYGTIFLIQMAISLTGASTAALINAMTPVAVTAFAVMILKEQITPVKLLCIGLALAGTWVVTAGSDGQSDTTGILLAVLSVLFWGLSSVFMRKLTARYPAILVTAYGMMISLLLHIPTGIISLVRAGDSIQLRPLTVLILLYLGLAGSGLAQYTWTSALAILPASLCSLFYPLQPIFSSILGFFILGERFTGYFFAGLALVSLDVVLSTMETMRQK